jgi:polyisoprenoid-binding protein YceI
MNGFELERRNMTAVQHDAVTAQSTWAIDAAHSQVGFAVKHLMISTVRGRFTGVAGTVQVDERDWTKSIANITIDTATVGTGQSDRDAHLRSADFFDVEKYPAITFVSTRIEPGDKGHFTLVGDLTIHGVTREVALACTEEGRGGDPWGGERIAFSATTAIDRRDFGLTWSQALETGGLVVSNVVKISLEVEFVKQAA